MAPSDFCTKCKRKGHAVRGCDQPWPDRDQQVCDYCHSDAHPTGSKDCKKRDRNTQYICKTCGHLDDHMTQACPIGDKTNEKHVRQWTKPKFITLEDERRKESNAKQKAQASTKSKSKGGQGGASQTTPRGGNRSDLPVRTGTNSAKASNNSKQAPKITKTLAELQADLKSKYKIEQVDKYAPPEKSKEQNQEEKWAKSNLKVAELPKVASTLQNGEAVEANFLSVSFLDSTKEVDIRKYRIELGKLKTDEEEEEDRKERETMGVPNNGGNRPSRPPKREVRKALIAGLFAQNPPSAANWTTDGLSHVVSRGRLFNDFSDEVGTVYCVTHFRPGRGNSGYQPVHTTIVYEGFLQHSKLLKHVNPKIQSNSDYFPDEDLRILNLLSWQRINRAGFPGHILGKKFFPDEQPSHCSGVIRNKEISRRDPSVPLYNVRTGYFTSMRPGSGNILLNVNASTSVFFAPVNLSLWIRCRWPNGLNLGNWGELRGLQVEFEGDHYEEDGGFNSRKRRVIRGYDRSTASNKFFGDGTNAPHKSVYTHMMSAYSHLNQPTPFDRNAPVFDLGFVGKELWYPADKLRIVDWQIVRGMPPIGSDDMLRIATRTPDVNRELIVNKAFPHLGIGQNEPVSQNIYLPFGIQILPEFVEVTPCRLVRPTLRYANTNNGADFGDKQATWAITNVGRRNGGLLKVDNVRRNLTNLHVIRVATFSEPRDITWLENNFRNALATSFRVMASRGLRRLVGQGAPNGRILGNVALKINFKLRGTNHRVENIGLKDRTIVMGADVTHPGKMPDLDTFVATPSMAGVVGTVDAVCANYLASARLQLGKTEAIANLQDMVKERLEAYLTNSKDKKPPLHILFYRDGVSESQFGMVREVELPQIRAACDNLNITPTITLVIVGKRHHARFFPKGANRKNNMLPGSVVSETVVAPRQFSYYLQSHDSPLGTARSAHYVVLENQTGYTGDQLKKITHNLSFTGSRATHALSVCTPARYADLLCNRLRCYMYPALNLSKTWPVGTMTATIAQDQDVWGRNLGGGRLNPWHPYLDDIMFYL